jgi:hypothetical protein
MMPDTIPLGFEFALHTDPVTGEKEVILRRRHNITRSPRLMAFRSCVRQHMEGRRFRTGDPVLDTVEVREAFAKAAHECAREA